MQSGSFVNLSRLRKEQAAARALQEQQQQQQQQQAQANAAIARQQQAEALQRDQTHQTAPHGQWAGATSSAYPQELSVPAPHGSSGSTPSSSTGHSPLTSPPPDANVYLGSSSAPSDAPLLSPNEYSLHHQNGGLGGGSGGSGGAGAFSLVRRHHTVGARPQKYLSATQKERLDEEDSEGGGSRNDGDGASTGAVEGDGDSLGSVLEGGAFLARAGSLPSKPSASFMPSPGSISRSSGVKRRPSLGAARLEPIPAASSLYANSPSPDPKSPLEGSYEADAEWERALAQSRKAGHHSDLGHDPRYAPSASRLQSHRSLQFPPGSYNHHTQQQQPGYSYPTSPPLASTSMHQRSGSNISDSHLYTQASNDPGVRRVQSLTQGAANPRLGDRLAVVAPGSHRSEDLQHTLAAAGGGVASNGAGGNEPLSRQNSASRLKASELPPPSSPIKHSPWTSSVSPLPPNVGASRTWGAEEAFGGPLSPVPQIGNAKWGGELGSLEERFSGVGGNGDYYDAHLQGAPLSQEELQNAFDAMNLGHSVGASAFFSPPLLGVPGTHPPLNPHAPMLHPPTIRSQSRGSSRGPSRNQNRSPGLPPPRFASPGDGSFEQQPDLANQFLPPVPPFNHPMGGGGAGYQPSPYDHPALDSVASQTASLKLSLLTDPSSLGEVPQQRLPAGPASASAFVPPIGHTSGPHLLHHPGEPNFSGGLPSREQTAYGKPFTASGTGWEQKHAIMGGSGPFPSAMPFGGQPQLNPLLAAQAQAILAAQSVGRPYPSVLSHAQYTQSLGSATGFLQSNGLLQPGQAPDAALVSRLAALGGAGNDAQPALNVPSQVDMNALIEAKGYNPSSFNTDPPQARFFVIKSFTEDDVAKSLKFEIWSSTTFGNKRLDLAFKESAAQMPIYLFFSVNSSGRFAGMAQMLTDVDYNTTSTVWAQDKWKGVFRLKWIYVKDIPNGALRHIRLTNTPEQKPVTNSRDTQELPFEGGLEMLKIFHAYQPRTTLLQDFPFYEELEHQKTLQQQADATRQPTAHLPPFPGQPTVPQRPPSTGPQNGSSRSTQRSQQQQPQNVGPSRGGRGYSGPSPPQAPY